MRSRNTQPISHQSFRHDSSIVHAYESWVVFTITAPGFKRRLS